MKSLLMILLVVSLGCNDFYKNYAVDDLWRIPLLKPYELKNTAGASPSDFSNDNWHLVFTRKNSFDDFDGVNITMINVDKSIIYGYGTKNPSQHFIINYLTKEEIKYENEKEWNETLVKLGIVPTKLYNVWDVFETFRNEGKLPWQAEIDKVKAQAK